MQARASQGGLVPHELHEQAGVARPDLAQEQRVHDARRLHQAGQGLALGSGQGRKVGGDGDGSEARGHGLEARGIRQRRGRGGALLGAGDHREAEGGGKQGGASTHGPSWRRGRERVNERAAR